MIERGGVSDRALIGWIEGGEKKVVGEAAFGTCARGGGQGYNRITTGSCLYHGRVRTGV